MNRAAVLARDNSCCRFWASDESICGSTTGLSLHHVIPRREGGNGCASNLVTVCRGHHNLIEKYPEKRLRQHYLWIAEGRIGYSPMNARISNKFVLPKAALKRAALASPRFAGAALNRW